MLAEVGRLPDPSMRELHRLLHNAQEFEQQHEHGSRTDYLKALGTKDDSQFETLLHALDSARTFDILLFRGTDFVSDAIAKVSQGHGADHFSHVGMVIKAPLVPRHGRYMKAGAIDTTGEFGNIPFINLNMKIIHDAGTGKRILRVRVAQCVRLPDRLDEGSLKEDPYVRLVLEPEGDKKDIDRSALGFRVGPNTKGIDPDMMKEPELGPGNDGQTPLVGNPAHTPYKPQAGPAPVFDYTMDLPFPEEDRGQTADDGHFVGKPQLRIEVWDKDWASPDDLIAETLFPLDSQVVLAPLEKADGYDAWLRLEVADASSIATDRGGLRSLVSLPELGPQKSADEESAPSAGTTATPEDETIKGSLLMAPLGRRYKKLYDTEKPSMGCRTSTYKMLFTWRYFTFLCVLVAWSLINYLWFLVMFHQTHGSVRWSFNSTAELTANEEAECLAEGMDMDECELFNWWFTGYTQISDWVITALFCVDVVMRLYCLGWRQWYAVRWNIVDLCVTAFDIVFNILQYQRRAVASVQVMRTMRFVRAASIVALYLRIRIYKGRMWVLHAITVAAVGKDVQISWNLSGYENSDDDRTAKGPYSIDHRIDPANCGAGTVEAMPTDQASPARVLDRGRHIKYLRHQSEFCFLVVSSQQSLVALICGPISESFLLNPASR